jgi:hypothetical protein
VFVSFSAVGAFPAHAAESPRNVPVPDVEVPEKSPGRPRSAAPSQGGTAHRRRPRRAQADPALGGHPGSGLHPPPRPAPRRLGARRRTVRAAPFAGPLIWLARPSTRPRCEGLLHLPGTAASLRVVAAPRGAFGAVHDPHHDTLTAVVKVSSRAFALLETRPPSAATSRAGPHAGRSGTNTATRRPTWPAPSTATCSPPPTRPPPCTRRTSRSPSTSTPPDQPGRRRTHRRLRGLGPAHLHVRPSRP